MYKYKNIFYLLFLIILLSGCNIDLSLESGSGVITTEEREVSGFNEVSLTGIGKLTITTGDEEKLTIRAEDNVIDKVKTEVRGNTLSIGLVNNFHVIPTKPIEIDLQVKEIKGIDLSGAGSILAVDLVTEELDVTLSGAGDLQIESLQADLITAEVSGAGSFEISGTVDSQTIEMSAAGSYKAQDLECRTAVVDVSGVGSVKVWVVDFLDVEISGAGSVSYYGSPRLEQDISGVGSIKSLGEHDW